MEFPSAQLLLILNAIRGKQDWNTEVLLAAMDVVKYIVANFANSDFKPIGTEDFDPDTAISTILGENEAKGVGAALWIQLGLWLLTKIIERYSK